jgi:chromosome segregation ATPase
MDPTEVLARCRAQLQQLYAVAQAEEQKKLRRWNDELPMLESFITAMTSTRDIIVREQKQLKADLTNLKAYLDKQAAEAAKQAPSVAVGSNTTALREQLEDLQDKLSRIEEELEILKPLLSNHDLKADERPLYETKLVVLQVNWRFCQPCAR